MPKPLLATANHERRVAAYCESANVERRVRTALENSFDVRIARRPEDMEEFVAEADCALVATDRPNDDVASRALSIGRRIAPDIPAVLVTAKDIRNAEAALHLGFDDVVWLTALSVDLPRVLDQLCERSFLLAVARNAGRAHRLPAALQDAIAAYCRSRDPIRSIERAAKLSGWSRTTIWRAWDKVAPAGMSLKAFQDWILLLHAVARRASGASWESIAESLGIDGGTTARIAKRLLGRGLMEMGHAQTGVVREEFGSRVLVPLGIRTPWNRMR